MLDSEAPYDRLYIQMTVFSGKIQVGHIHPGMRLMPRHGGSAVVKNDQGEIMIVVQSIYQTCHS